LVGGGLVGGGSVGGGSVGGGLVAVLGGGGLVAVLGGGGLVAVLGGGGLVAVLGGFVAEGGTGVLLGRGVNVGRGVREGSFVFVGITGVLVGGIDVGGIDVGGTEVALGLGSGVEVGKSTGVLLATGITTWVGNGVGIEVAVRSEERFWAVWVKGGTRVFDGVMVTEAVIVGVAEIRGVAVAVNEAVLVGIVEVGKGPRSALAVPAMAVFSPDTPPCDCPPSPDAVVSRKVTAKTTTIRPRHNVICSNACSATRFCFFTLTAFLQS
jgi:hypothetical protein